MQMTRSRQKLSLVAKNPCTSGAHHWKIEATDESPLRIELQGYCIKCRMVRYFPREQEAHYNGVPKAYRAKEDQHGTSRSN